MGISDWGKEKFQILCRIKDKGWSFKLKHHFLIQVLQYPGNEAKFWSYRNWGCLTGKIWSPYLRAPSFGFGGTSNFPPFQIPTTPRNHFSPPMNQIYLHCLPQFAWGVHLTKCNPRYWSQKMPSGDICTPERGRPIPQSSNSPPNRLSQYHFSAFSLLFRYL